MSADYAFVATAPRGLGDLLAQELTALGAEARERAGTVRFEGELQLGYKACLWSRVASRVLLQLAQFQAATADEFYARVRELPWSEHIAPDGTIACEFSGTHPAITHTHFGALRFKDAIVDSLRADTGRRPDVQLERPGVRLHAHANGTHIVVSVDLSGEPLSRRGYRIEAGAAPLRENLAAGLLLRSRWPEAAARGEQFLDPMCGSGTLVIEAGLIAQHRAPGLLRDYFGFLGWLKHDAATWGTLCEQARVSMLDSFANVVRGSDLDARALTMARANAERAGLGGQVVFEHRPVSSAMPAPDSGAGLVCTNPPYGERLGDSAAAVQVYAELGQALRQHFVGWDAAILTPSPATAQALQLRSYRVHEVWNGPLACRLLRVDLNAPGAADREQARLLREQEVAERPGAKMFANRLQKNLRRLQRVARREQVDCYRLYDADMPEYAFAVDRYLDCERQLEHLYVQEYLPPDTVDAESARRRRQEALASLPRVLNVPSDRIHVRTRKRQSGTDQYQREEQALDRTFTVREGGLIFVVNLDEYLDTGLFLDHRLTRARIRDAAADTRFLNLFCYTSSVSVYAAAGGARSSVSVDLSNTYLDWAAHNYRLNQLDAQRHRLVRADCREWLQQTTEVFDLIFLDPPTFSNSKRMQGVLDVQRDHLELITLCMQRLSSNGLLVFSTNAQRFKLEESVTQRWRAQDISARTLPFDYERNPRIHRCFEIRPPAPSQTVS